MNGAELFTMQCNNICGSHRYTHKWLGPFIFLFRSKLSIGTGILCKTKTILRLPTLVYSISIRFICIQYTASKSGALHLCILYLKKQRHRININLKVKALGRELGTGSPINCGSKPQTNKQWIPNESSCNSVKALASHFFPKRGTANVSDNLSSLYFFLWHNMSNRYRGWWKSKVLKVMVLSLTRMRYCMVSRGSDLTRALDHLQREAFVCRLNYPCQTILTHANRLRLSLQGCTVLSTI